MRTLEDVYAEAGLAVAAPAPAETPIAKLNRATVTRLRAESCAEPSGDTADPFARGVVHPASHGVSSRHRPRRAQQPLHPSDVSTPRVAPRPRRLAWAELLKRVFAIDVLECPRCGGRTRVLSVPPPPDAAAAILDCLGLRSRAPPPAAPRPEEFREDSSVEID